MVSPRQVQSSIDVTLYPVALLAHVPFVRNRDGSHRFSRGVYSFRRAAAPFAGRYASDSARAVLRLLPVARGLQIFRGRPQKGGVVAAQSDRTIALGA